MPTVGAPIFLLGCPRSGTTLMQLMLHAHPRLVVPPENRYVLPAYERRAEWGDLGEPANRARLAKFVVAHSRSFTQLGLNPKEVRAALTAAPPTLGSVLDAAMRCFVAQAGAARWCDKRPMYVRHVPALLRLFPDAQFLHLVRDGRAAAASLNRMTWFRGDLDQAIGTWLLAMEHADAARERLGPDRWLDLSYEALVTDPEPELRRVCSFLGEDFAPAMLEPGAVAREVVADRKTWHANTAGPLLTERTASWRRELPAADIAFLEAVAGRRLTAAGYPLSGDGRADRLRVAKFAVGYRRRRWWYAREQKRDDRAAAAETRPLATLYASGESG